jgi:phage tail sheath protein FI
MLQLKAPGVYTQEKDSGVHAIGGAPTAVALFVGATRSGIDDRRTRVTSFADYQRRFGGLDPGSSLSYSVMHFFANGGGEAWILRVKPEGATAAALQLKKDGDTAASIALTALSSGSAGNELFAEVDPFGIGINPYDATHDKTRFNLTLTDRASGRVERFGALSTKSDSTRFAPDVLAEEATGSQLASLEVKALGAAGPRATGSIYRLKPLPDPTKKFTDDQDAAVTVRLLDASGTYSDASPKKGVIWSDTVKVFEKDALQPGNAVAVAAALKAAINTAIRKAGSTAPDSLKQAGVEVDAVEGGAFLRLRIGAPAASPDADRLSDATVAVDGGTGKFATTFVKATVLENVSRYRVGAAYVDSKFGGATLTTEVAQSTAGQDDAKGLQPKTADFKQAVIDLGQLDPFFNTLCLPDLVRASAADPAVLFHGEAKAIYEEAAQVCQEKFAFLLVDPFPGIVDADAAELWKAANFTLQSEHAAIYFPNIRVDDPLEPGSIRSHPPSGAIAGLFARNDSRTGVWEAPAGTDAVISGAYGPSVVLSDAQHGQLNPIGVNVIRKFPVYGTVNFGSRTVNGLDVASSDYKYVPVRRTANHIERSVSEGLRWAVHKPNGEQLWSQIRLAVNSFMQGLFRQGAFKGTSAREAYFVACDSSTTTPDDIAQGVVNVSIGFAPLRPAEFVVITLRQIVQAQA